MFFKKRKESRFDNLDPNDGPQMDISIRENSGQHQLIPDFMVATSKDGCRLNLVSCRFTHTFDGIQNDHPWAMSVNALKTAENEAEWVMPPWFHRLDPAPPGEEHKAVALPSYRFDLHLTSHDYVPEEDESCCGSQLRLTWFNDKAEGWVQDFANAALEDLLWKFCAKPNWRTVTT